VTAEALSLEPLATARGTSTVGVERVPYVETAAHPGTVPLRLPGAPRAADARAPAAGGRILLPLEGAVALWRLGATRPKRIRHSLLYGPVQLDPDDDDLREEGPSLSGVHPAVGAQGQTVGSGIGTSVPRGASPESEARAQPETLRKSGDRHYFLCQLPQPLSLSPQSQCPTTNFCTRRPVEASPT
jgi:hypothetical protein